MGKIHQQLLDYTSEREREREQQEQEQDTKKPETHGKNWLDSPWVKATGITIITVGVLWASSFFFSALGASVKSFKKMSRSFKE